MENQEPFDLDKTKEEGTIPEEIKQLAKERETSRQEKNWAKSDELRKKINSLGYEIKDTETGFKIQGYKKPSTYILC